MAGILKGKKGQMVDFVIVLIVLFSVSALLSKGLSDKDEVIQIGGKQYSMLSAYAEGEKALEYIRLAGELALAEKVDNCADAKVIPLGDIELAVRDEIRKRMQNYTIPNTALDMDFNPDYYIYTASQSIDRDSTLGIVGTTSEKIRINSNDYKFNYSINGNFRSVLTCDKLSKLKPQSQKALLAG